MNAYIFIIIGLVAIFAITEVIAILTHINWIRFIGAIAAIVFLFALTFLFNQNYTVDTKSWKNGVYEISKDADGTFYYVDLADKKIKKANTKDNDVYMSWTTSDKPIIYQGTAQYGFLENDIIIYCMPYQSDATKDYNEAYKESIREEIINELKDEEKIKS